ncbi:uncharacterized protein [Argopecten irradians]|uniref:uncharacterized protein isoform X1 n=2 Tax=Argopecten irradians TaxID=31199 RepID=UPI00371F1AD4
MEDSPNTILMHLDKDGKGDFCAPPHMKAFCQDVNIQQKFRDLAASRRWQGPPTTQNSSPNVTRALQRPIKLPFKDANCYGWDSLVLIIPRILRILGLRGRQIYTAGNRPSWWPEDVPFASPNNSSAAVSDSFLISVTSY